MRKQMHGSKKDGNTIKADDNFLSRSFTKTNSNRGESNQVNKLQKRGKNNGEKKTNKQKKREGK